MRSHRRPGPLEHVLVAGEVADLERIATTLALLPETAYGQVFVECPTGTALPNLSRPPRVGLTRLEPTAGVRPGVVLAAAVAAWREEWMPELPDADRELSIWSGEIGSWV